MSDKLKENYCFFCTSYGSNNLNTCYNCGQKIGDYPLEILVLLTTTLNDCLPHGNSIVQPDLSDIPDNAHWIYFKGQNYAIDQTKANLQQLLGSSDEK